MIRRRPVQRLTFMLIGAIITALGGITMAVSRPVMAWEVLLVGRLGVGQAEGSAVYQQMH